MGKILAFISLAIAICIVAGCNTSGCIENQNSVPLAGFYSSGTGKEIGLTGVEVGGVDAPNDSLLHNGVGGISEVYLPLRSTRNNTAFYFHYNQEGIDSTIYNDTIRLEYTSKPMFVSEECGAMYYYHITKLTHTSHLIDSVVLTDSLITNIDVRRINIYFRTDTEEGGTK